MSALAKVQDQQVAAPAADAGALIQMIERAAMNPAVDIDKMERLLQMQERVLERNARAAFASALADMQSELPAIAERGKISTDRGKTVQSRYALWEDINDAIKPILAKHGFALSFRTGQDEGKVTVTGVLSHREGHAEQTTMHLPADGSGSKNAVQAVGSSLSYGKRYTASALLNLTSRGEDDDGQAAGAGATITEDQAAEMRALMQDVGADEARFLTYLKVERLAELPAGRLKDAIAALEAKRVGK